jgi:hypothetical protein
LGPNVDDFPGFGAATLCRSTFLWLPDAGAIAGASLPAAATRAAANLGKAARGLRAVQLGLRTCSQNRKLRPGLFESRELGRARPTMYMHSGGLPSPRPPPPYSLGGSRRPDPQVGGCRPSRLRGWLGGGSLPPQPGSLRVKRWVWGGAAASQSSCFHSSERAGVVALHLIAFQGRAQSECCGPALISVKPRLKSVVRIRPSRIGSPPGVGL